MELNVCSMKYHDHDIDTSLDTLTCSNHSDVTIKSYIKCTCKKCKNPYYYS